MPKLNIHSIHLIYGDNEVATANPKRLYVDWTRDVNNLTVENPHARSYEIDPGASLALFSGFRVSSIDGTTAFSLSLSPLSTTTYRLNWTGGTSPGFRTDRALALSGRTIAVAVNNNASATFTLATGSFAGVQVGDTLLVPGVSTGDPASPFNPANNGSWQVIAVTSSTLTVIPAANASFSGVGETVALTSNAQLQAFSPTGVQIGDTLSISAGFSLVTQKTLLLPLHFTLNSSAPRPSRLRPAFSPRQPDFRSTRIPAALSASKSTKKPSYGLTVLRTTPTAFPRLSLETRTTWASLRSSAPRGLWWW